jgi:hypothetical protein
MSTSTRTKSQLEDEVENLRANLEDAHQLLGRALGYSTLEDGEDYEEPDDSEDDDAEENDESQEDDD